MAAIQEHLLRHRRAPEAAAHEALFDAGIESDVRAISAPESLEYAGSSTAHEENGVSGL